MADYTTLANVKLALKITDSTRDTLLSAAISAASEGLDNHTGRLSPGFSLDGAATARTYSTRKRVLRTNDGELLFIDEFGSTTGLVVETGTAASSWVAVASTSYETEPENAIATSRPIRGLLMTNGRWPQGSTRVRITAKWGWPAVPKVVEQAALIQATRLFMRKDSPEGVAGNAEWGAVRLGRVDPDVQALVKDLVLDGFA